MPTALGIIKTSLGLYLKNMPALVWATFIYAVSAGVSLGAAASVLLILFFFLASLEAPSSIFNPIMALMSAIVGLALFFVISGLKAAYFQMCHIASRGGSASILGFLEYASRKAIPAFVIEGAQAILLLAFCIIPALVLLVFGSKIIGIAILAISLIAGFLASFAFSLALPSHIMDGTNSKSSINRSIALVSENRFRFYLVILMALSLASIVTLIPFFGPILLFFFALPLTVICLFVFYSQVRTL